MTTLLCQIVAVEKGLQARTDRTVTGIYHTLQKSALFNGFVKHYEPVDTEGERFPDEELIAQHDVETALRQAGDALTELLDVTLTKDVANTMTMAPVIVNGVTVVTAAPVPYLLFLEKQLIDMRTVFHKLPVLDPAQRWEVDPSTGTFRTAPTKSSRTKKVPKVLTKAPSTDKFPAQTEVYMEDVTIGHWEQTKFSGAVTQKRKDQLIKRVDTLLDAVKAAVEEANQVTVNQMTAGPSIFNYLLA